MAHQFLSGVEGVFHTPGARGAGRIAGAVRVREVSVGGLLVWRRLLRRWSSRLSEWTKYTVQLDDKSALEVNDLHRGLLSNQKLVLEEYKLEQKELFSQNKQDLKSIAAGQGLWLSSKALAVALVVFELLLVVVGVVVFNWTKAKCTRWAAFQGLLKMASRYLRATQLVMSFSGPEDYDTAQVGTITIKLYKLLCCNVDHLIFNCKLRYRVGLDSPYLLNLLFQQRFIQQHP